VQGEQLTKEQTMNASERVGDWLGGFPKNPKQNPITRIPGEEAKRLAILNGCAEHHTRINPPGTLTEAFFSTNPAQSHLVVVVAKNMSGHVSYSGLWIDASVTEESVIMFMGGFSEFISLAMQRGGVPAKIELLSMNKERN
jgi:hypothetical protein